MTENIALYQSQIALARTEIKNLRQRISALKYEHQKEMAHIKSTLNNLRCSNCAAEATTVVSKYNNDEELHSSFHSLDSSVSKIDYQPIGHIETTFSNKRGVPRQPSVMTNAKGVITIDTRVFNNPEHALSGLEEFSHIWIIFHFHMTESTGTPAKVSPPRLVGERKGVFSTRSPHRPCPIGLSLVKIHSIEGNQIHFYGVDMVNGTPVLDIKPYIPQYDYPATFGDGHNISDRPPTEGISDGLDLDNLQIEDSALMSLSPHTDQPIGIDTSPVIDISPNDVMTPVSPTEDLLDGPLRSVQRVERGDPDGQERFTPPQTSLNTHQDGIRVATWVINPPSRTYRVVFTDDVVERLNNLIGDRADAFKSNIECLLSEDPRSVYVKTRYPDHEYSCVLEDLSISCVFDETSAVCKIIAVRSAEELQN